MCLDAIGNSSLYFKDLVRWNFTSSDTCDCDGCDGAIVQTIMKHLLEYCPGRKYDGGILDLHS